MRPSRENLVLRPKDPERQRVRGSFFASIGDASSVVAGPLGTAQPINSSIRVHANSTKTGSGRPALLDPR
jgi:hypothetical protein